MRELKDYFCTYNQSKELIELGFIGAVLAVHLGSTLRQIPLAYNLNAHEIKAPLRCQALDFFRDLGYIIQIRANQHGHWYEFEKDGITRTQGQWHTYSTSEGALIDRLIELEKEARNGK